MILVSLVGEQPIPNLLPILYLQPAVAVLVHSGLTRPAADRLSSLLPACCGSCAWQVDDPYDIERIRADLSERLAGEGWSAGDLVFNLTGGTKPMSFAAYLVASGLRASFVYLQTEGKQSRLYHYAFDTSGAPCPPEWKPLPVLLDIDTYLRVFVKAYQVTGYANAEDGGLFERAIHEALMPPVVDEILVGVKLLGAVDVDFVVRCGNQIGIIEAKTGKGVKKGIDQLNTAGGQRYLGTYTEKVLVSDQHWDRTRSNLRELAEARRVEVIELPSFAATGELSAEDKASLANQVRARLGRPAREADAR
jgi:hypothetical protein